jgi:hypothetical protein
MRLMCSLSRNEYRNFKLARATMGSRLGRSEETERGESTGAVSHICMGTTQGNSLCSHLYLNVAKHQVSCFIFYVFFFYKIGE